MVCGNALKKMLGPHGTKLPYKHWETTGLALSYEEASQIRQMPDHSEMTSKENLKRFPPDRSTLIEIFQFLKWCKANDELDLWHQKLADNTINHYVRKREIRQLKNKAWDQHMAPTSYKLRGVWNFEEVPKNSVDMIFASPRDSHDHEPYKKITDLAYTLLKDGGWLALRCHPRSIYSIAEIVGRGKLRYCATLAIRRQTKDTYRDFIHSWEAVILLFQHPVRNHPHINDCLDYEGAYRRLIETLTEPGSLIVDLTPGSAIRADCESLGRRCVDLDENDCVRYEMPK